MNKTQKKKTKQKLTMGITLLIITLIIIQIVYLYHFFTQGLFIQYGNTLTTLKSFEQWSIFSLILIFIGLSLLMIFYGCLRRRLWTRNFTISFLLWALLLPIWSILMKNHILGNLLLIGIYFIILLVLLKSPYISTYFTPIYRHGDFTLYKKIITTKNGKSITLHFFSKKKPKNSTPTALPAMYVVKINQKTRMPYLKKRAT